MIFLSKEIISVSIGILFNGAVSMTLMSLIPINLLDDNNIKEIPDSLIYLENLIALSLDNNNIEKFPDSLSKIKNLEELDVKMTLNKIDKECKRKRK